MFAQPKIILLIIKVLPDKIGLYTLVQLYFHLVTIGKVDITDLPTLVVLLNYCV